MLKKLWENQQEFEEEFDPDYEGEFDLDFDEDDLDTDEEFIQYEEYEIEDESEDDEDDEDEWDGQEDVFDTLEEDARKPYAHLQKVILTELIVFVVISLSILVYHHWKHDPERLVEGYVRNIVQRDWNDAYGKLYFKNNSDELLTKKLFVSARELNANNAEIVRSEVRKVKPLTKDHTLYQVEYMKNDEIYTEEVPLVRLKGVWKVDGDAEFIKKNVGICVPKGAAVYYDGIKLGKKYTKESKGEKQVYQLPEIFNGMHYIRVEKQGMETAERLVNPDQEETFEIKLKYGQELLKKAGEQAVADMKTKYENTDIGRTKLIGLKLGSNRITAKTTGDHDELIEVTVESQYEYQYKPNKYYRRVRTEKGSVKNVGIYSYDGENLKLEKMELDDGFLRKDGGRS